MLMQYLTLISISRSPRTIFQLLQAGLNAFLDARSNVNKKNELNILGVDVDPHIISMTESWANKDIADAELGLTGYVIIRRDRIGRIGGELHYILNNIFRM